MNELFQAIKCGDPSDLAGRAVYFEKKFPQLGQKCARVKNKPHCYRSSIDSCIWSLFLWHFGFRAAVTPNETSKKALELGEAYFKVVAEDLAKSSNEIAWYKPYSNSLLVSILSERKEARRCVSESLHPGLIVENMAVPVEPTLGDFLLCVASEFQRTAMDVTKCRQRLERTRKKRPTSLLRAKEALHNQDRSSFVGAIKDATADFAHKTAEDLPIYAIAIPESILLGLAGEYGWMDLSFEPDIAARHVTRRSLNLI